MTMVDVYLEVGGAIVLVALSVCVVYLSLRLRSVNAQKKHLPRRSSILADKMADAVRGMGEQLSPGPPPARRRRQYPQLGRLHRGNSLPSNPRGRQAYLVPREDSPLLGLEPVLLDEEKEEITSWSPPARVSLASDVDKTHMTSRTQRGRVDEVNDSQSRMTAVSEEPTTMSATDEALLGTFMEVMSEGLAIKIHRISSHARKAVMWLKDRDTLVWSTKRTLGAKKWEKLQLSGGTKVQAGKGSESFGDADDALFLLLVLDSGPLGLEASSELERDALVQGFRMLIEDLKTNEKLGSV